MNINVNCISHNDQYQLRWAKRFHGQVHFLLVHRPWTNDWINSTIRHYWRALLPLSLSLSLPFIFHIFISCLHLKFDSIYRSYLHRVSSHCQVSLTLVLVIDVNTIPQFNVPFCLLCTLQWLPIVMSFQNLPAAKIKKKKKTKAKESRMNYLKMVCHRFIHFIRLNKLHTLEKLKCDTGPANITIYKYIWM